MIPATGKLQLSASALNDASKAGVSWSSNMGAVDTAGLFTAPPTITASYAGPGTPQLAVVTATSKVDSSRQTTFQFWVAPLSGVNTSTSLSTVYSTQKVQLTAKVPDDRSGAGVTWTTSAGAISSSGLLTSPAVTVDTVVTVTAKSVADPSKSSSVAVLVRPVSAVRTAAAVASLAAGETLSLSSKVYDVKNSGDGTVTWSASLGTITSSGVYTAPASNTLTAPTDAVITATARAGNPPAPTDGSLPTYSQRITINPVRVDRTDQQTSVRLGSSVQLRAEVVNDQSQQGVTWSTPSQYGTVSSTGLFTVTSVIPTPLTATVFATSKADTTKVQRFDIDIRPPTVQIALPMATVPADSFVQLAAYGNDDLPNASVKWSSNVGFVTDKGRFVPPPVNQVTQVTLEARSSNQTAGYILGSVVLTLNPETVNEVAGWVRKQEMVYDNDNRVLTTTTPALSGSTTDASYSYQRVQERNTYVVSSVTKNGQVFETLTKMTHATVLGGITDGDGIVQFTNTDTLNAQGLIVEQKREGEGQIRTTGFKYHLGTGTTTGNTSSYTLNEASFTSLNTTVSAGLVTSSAASIKRYADTVYEVTETGSSSGSPDLSRTTRYEYNALGYPILQTELAAFNGVDASVTPTAQDRTTRRAFNGFGRRVWELVTPTTGTVTSAQATRYDASGATLASWTGSPKNLALYSYDAVGRVSKIERGVGANGTLSQSREKKEFSYDDFSRVASSKVDGFQHRLLLRLAGSHGFGRATRWRSHRY